MTARIRLSRASAARLRMCGRYRQKFCGGRQRRAGSTRPSCSTERLECRFDFIVGRDTATFRVVDRFELLRRGAVYAGTPRLDGAGVFGELLLVLRRPGLDLLKQLFGARAH